MALSKPSLPFTKVIPALFDLLHDVDAHPALYLNHRVLRNAIRRYEHFWLPLLALHPHLHTSLVAPLDVEWVAFVHMLCPTKYAPDVCSILSNAVPDAAPLDMADNALLPQRERIRARARAEALWKQAYPDEPFDVCTEIRAAPLREEAAPAPEDSKITYDIVAAAERQSAFYYQTCIMPQYKQRAFLRGNARRYGQFLELQRGGKGQIWVPTYDIDVTWHAHMAHPRLYARATTELCGRVISHDDTMNDRTGGSTLLVRWAATRKRWWQEFGEPIGRHGGMWRGNVSPEELMVKNDVVNEIATVHGEATELNLEVREMQENSLVNGLVQWDDIEWVHATGWRIARERAAGGSDEVEETTFSECVTGTGTRLMRSRMVRTAVEKSNSSHVYEYSFVEIFGAEPGEFGNTLPLASAHVTLPESICRQKFARQRQCAALYDELVLVLRIGGEDYALLAGSARPGGLRLRVWYLSPGTPDCWQRLGCGNLEADGLLSKMPPQDVSKVRYHIKIPGERFPRTRSFARSTRCSLDLGSGEVTLSSTQQSLPLYLFYMSASLLYDSFRAHMT